MGCFSRLMALLVLLFLLGLMLVVGFPAFANHLGVIGGPKLHIQALHLPQLSAPAAPAASVASSDLRGRPTVSAAFLGRVLTFYRSPAAGSGRPLYDLGVQYGIDA